MKEEEAKTKICPYLNKNCITEECMMWVTEHKGKKAIDTIVEPYDMTPGDVIRWIQEKKEEGYVDVGRGDGFRTKYTKFEETFDGNCSLVKTKLKDTL